MWRLSLGGHGFSFLGLYLFFLSAGWHPNPVEKSFVSYGATVQESKIAE